VSFYPIPAYAVSIWIAGDSLLVAFPGTVSEQGHTIKLPASTAGLKTALDIAKARSEATSLLLGNAGTPTQYEIEARGGAAFGAVSRRMREEREAATAASKAEAEARLTAKKRKAAREAAEATEFLKELGL
jgi:hypothetical protein